MATKRIAPSADGMKEIVTLTKQELDDAIQEAAQKLAGEEFARMQSEAQSQPEQEPDPQDIKIMQMIEEHKNEEGAVIRIYRQGKTYRDITLLDEMSLDDFTPMMLALEPYNGGTFRIHARSKSGILLNQSITVARKSPEQKPATEQSLTAADVARIVAESIKAAIPQRDPLQEMTALAGIMKTIMPAPVADPARSTDPFAMMRGIIEITKMLQPEKTLPEGSSASDHALVKGLDLVGELFKQHMNQQAPSGAAVVPVGAAVAENPALPSPTSEEEQMSMMVKLQLMAANREAANNTDPATYAEKIYALIPDEVLEMIAYEQNWFAGLTNILPDCEKHKEWYGKLRDKIVDLALEDEVLEPVRLTPDLQLRISGEHGATDTGKPTATPASPAKQA